LKFGKNNNDNNSNNKIFMGEKLKLDHKSKSYEVATTKVVAGRVR